MTQPAVHVHRLPHRLKPDLWDDPLAAVFAVLIGNYAGLEESHAGKWKYRTDHLLTAATTTYRVPEVILGYTCANDVTARDLQARDGQWGRAKGFDTFCPLGPWIATDVDPDDLAIECEVNEQIRQDGTTADMLRGVPERVAWISSANCLISM